MNDSAVQGRARPRFEDDPIPAAGPVVEQDEVAGLEGGDQARRALINACQ
jgi:hypothetical protein